ncbi:phenylalanine--tRNA ligase subunit alpha [Candidatus Peribacteria bacterium]|nr:phenylalanine--tRNA ligase subunit alpha [Candidatus Peribacteria bacterium]
MVIDTHDWQAFAKRIAACKAQDALDALEHELFGRKAGILTVALKDVGALDPDARRTQAALLNAAKRTLTDAIEAKRKELLSPSQDALASGDSIDITMELPRKERGHLHLIPEFIRSVEEVFGRMGFDVWKGPEIESEDMNFNLLNIPAEHPARDAQDTFWVESSKLKADSSKLVLRTHTSPVQIRYMQSHKPPFRAIFPGKVYRKDADATHSPMFHQFEGLMIGKDINLAHMKSVMITAIRELIDPKAEFRFRTGYFPFVEPGLEVDMRWMGDDAQSREGKWLEIVGCGLVHPNVLENCKIDSKEWQGFAFGFGIERMIMLRNRIPDLRSFYEGDLRFLSQF